jgi:hypothetical protein
MVQANHTTVVWSVRPKIFGFEMVSCFWKRNVGICQFSYIETISRHTFTHVVYVIGYTKCTQTPPKDNGPKGHQLIMTPNERPAEPLFCLDLSRL